MNWKFWKTKPTHTESLARSTEWSWREKSGAHERHLQRRHNNPLFPATRRLVTVSEVLEARRKDDAEFGDLMAQVKAIELPDKLPANWGEFLTNIRERIDALKVRARQIGGDTTQIMDFLNSTRNDMANVWRACNKGNTEALDLFERAEAMARAQDQIFEGDFVNQMMRKDNCIPPEEVAPALLCENPAAVAAFWGVLPEAERVNVEHWIAKIVVDAQKEGFEIISIKGQLHAIGWPGSAA